MTIPANHPFFRNVNVIKNQLMRWEVLNTELEKNLKDHFLGTIDRHYTESKQRIELEIIELQSQIIKQFDELEKFGTNATGADRSIMSPHIYRLRTQLKEYQSRYGAIMRRHKAGLSGEETQQYTPSINRGIHGSRQLQSQMLRPNYALSHVGRRHTEVEAIAIQMEELSEAFEGVAKMVGEQEKQIQVAETHGREINGTVTGATKELVRGTKHAKRARKNKWRIFWALVIVAIAIVIVAVVVAVVFEVVIKPGKG